MAKSEITIALQTHCLKCGEPSSVVLCAKCLSAHQTTDAQQRGFDDFPLDRTENPYPEGTDGHVLWQNGWNTAFMIMKRRIEG